MRLVDLGDRVRQLAPAPVFLAVDLAARRLRSCCGNAPSSRALVRSGQDGPETRLRSVSTKTPYGLKASRHAVRQGAIPDCSARGAPSYPSGGAAQAAMLEVLRGGAGAAARTGRCPRPPRRSGSATAPAMGIRTSSSHRSRVRRRSPRPSPPSTIATGGASFAGYRDCGAPPIRPDHPDARLLEPLQRPREIRRAADRHGLGSAGRRLHGRGRQRRGVVLRHDDGIDAGRVRGAQARAEVARVLDAVEHEQPQRPAALRRRGPRSRRARTRLPPRPRRRRPGARRRRVSRSRSARATRCTATPRAASARASSASLPLASRRTFAADAPSRGRRSSSARTACKP